MTGHLVQGAEWRARAAAALAPVTPLLAVAPGHKPAYADLLVIDQHRVRLAQQCPARSASDDEDFRETSRTARRRVGLAVLGVLRADPANDPRSAFDEVLAERSRWFSGSLVEWLDQLEAGGRAAVAAEAIGYASAVAGWVAPRNMGDVAVCGPSDALVWSVPERAVRVKGRCDAWSPRGGRPPGRRLLVVVGGGLDHAGEVAGHAALAYTLTLGSVPGRVTVLAPATGKVAIAVDDALLAGALDRVVTAAQAGVAARFGPPAPATGGAWCRRCPRLDECPTGAAWVDGHPVRFGGLLPPGPDQG